MFYYDDSGCLGCLIGFIILLIVGAVLLSPYFWILVAVLVLWSAIRGALNRKRGADEDGETQESDSVREADDAFDAAKTATSEEDIKDEYETDVIDISDVEVETVDSDSGEKE